MPARAKNPFVVCTTNAANGSGAPDANLELALDATLPAEAVQVESSRRVRLGMSWQPIRATYGPHAITRLFVDRLLEHPFDAVEVRGLNTASAELLRCAHALGLPTQLTCPASAPAAADADAARWLRGLHSIEPVHQAAPLRWDYGLYSLGMRDHSLLQRMNERVLPHLSGCTEVIDVGCGTGVLLDQLRRTGVAATGIERDAVCVRYARSLGLDVMSGDAIEGLARRPGGYDALVCSHFVEHLDIEGVKTLLARMAGALRPGGVAVLVFPDPESIRSQLLGFWRDPEHVRFYHPDLIATLARVEGLACEYSSIHEDGRAVGPFSMSPPPAPAREAARPPSWLQRVALRLGWATRRELQALQTQVEHQSELIAQLWRANQTWAWEDNALLRLRKRSA